ncbi:MAG: DUF362 domain-containing protein [Bacteroidales bacterium]|nr:DUF362 domain-containing protein [Bacteroidales bacterium]
MFRVIPKPSRAAYPCMRAAAPFMSGFIIYITGLITSLFVFKKGLENFRKRKYIIAFSLIVFGLLVAVSYNTIIVKASVKTINAAPEQFTPNQPIGAAKGINPGRVVLFHDADATNKSFVPNGTNACYMLANVDSAIINKMTINSILSLTGKTEIKEAWDTLFRYFNINQGKGNKGYEAGEKIFIKINCNSAWGHPSLTGTEFNYYGSSLGRNLKEDYSFKNNVAAFGTHDGGPYIMLSVLNQLINCAGIPEENIYIGDPMRDIHKYNFEIMHSVFPNVHYLGHTDTYGRTLATVSSDTTIYFSDKGTLLKNYSNGALKGSKTFNIVTESDYIINIAALKAHSGEGMTSCAKNYFGTIGRVWALEMHNGMVSPNFDMSSRSKGTYRVLVDLMGHKDLGGKTMLYLVDGTFFSPDAYGRPVKFQNAPYNGDWPSSILVSQDIVAIESVCYDIIASQHTSTCNFQYITMTGICEHLEQAADPTKWPAGIIYDPEKDGTPLQSLGVYEHWNDPVNRQYSKNLGTGNGIELILKGPIEGMVACPTQLTAKTISNSEIELSWNDNSDREDSYVVEMSEGDSLHYSTIVTTEENSKNYVSGGLKEGIKYYFRVKAGNGARYSNEVSVVAGITSTIGVETGEESLKNL